MADQDESKMYQDLIGFLKSDRLDLRLAATEAVLAVKDREGMEKLVRHGIVDPLTRNCSQPGQVGVNALQALVQLSSHGTSAAQCVQDLMTAGGLVRMTEIVLSQNTENDKKWKQRVNFSMALLANMTRTESGAVELVGKTLPDEAVATNVDITPSTKPTLQLLLARFLSTHYYEEEAEIIVDDDVDLDGRYDDPYQHFAAVLMNSTQVEAGRRFVLRVKRVDDSTSTSVLQAILPQLRAKNPIRRRGIAGTIKNCCLETDSAWWLLEQVKLVKHLLYPLAGPEELEPEEKRGLDPDLWLEGPDKERERDQWTRLWLVESLLLLCATGRKSRERLRLERVYVVLKLADLVEEDETVSERINECVQYLRRDEAGTQEGSSDLMMQESLKGPTTANQVGSNEDYDDVD